MASRADTVTLFRPRRRARVRLGLGVVLLAAAAVGAALGVRLVLAAGEATPGVRVLGADLGGDTRARAIADIRAAAAVRLHRPVTVLAGGRTLTLRPERVLRVDAAATATAALREGSGFAARAAALLSPLPRAREVRPVLRVKRAEAGAYLRELARLGRPPVNPQLVVAGTAVAVKPGRPGTLPEGNRLLAALQAQVLAGGRVVRLAFRPSAPPITPAAAAAAARRARLVVSAPVVLEHAGDALGTLEPARLAPLLRFAERGTRIDVALDRDRLAALGAPLLERYRRDPVSARFVVSGGRVSIVRGALGYRPDPAGAARAIDAAAFSSGSRVAELPLVEVKPDLTSEEARALGIRRPVSSFTTDMGTSSANRIYNVHLMADTIDGTLIRPGETFSFNGRVGPRTVERGFREGQMIVGNLLLPSIGGGVCQTATTLFNNAWQLGLPIVERYNHSFYISHYPLGRDATVSWGGPDLKFRNDLSYGLLISASYTDETLTFTFYGTPEGRKVETETGPKTNWTEPQTTYAVDPSAKPGSVKLVKGSGEKGFDVTVTRRVYEGGVLEREDRFPSHYIAVGDTEVYGPGRTPPGPYFVIPPAD